MYKKYINSGCYTYYKKIILKKKYIMENIKKLKQEVRSALNIGAIVESYEPSTINGSQMKEALIDAVNESRLESVGSYLYVHNVLSTNMNVDSGAMKTVDLMESKLAENSFNAKLVYCFESVEADDEDRANVKESTLLKLEELASKDDVNECKNLIRSGMFSSARSFYPCLESLIKESELKKENVVVTSEHKVYNPITYNVNENGTMFISVGRKVFGLSKDKGVFETVAPNPKFSYISQVLEHMDYNHETSEISYNSDLLGNISVNESGITRVDETYDIKDFVKEARLIIESKCENKNEMTSNKNLVDAVVTIKENMDSIVVADNVLVVEKDNGERFALFNMGKQGYYVSVVESNFVPNITECFDTTKGAIDFMLKRSGYDATNFLALEMANEDAEEKKNKEIIDEQKGIINALVEKLNSINSMISEAKEQKNNKKVVILEQAKGLTESLIVEQKNNLVEFLKNG